MLFKNILYGQQETYHHTKFPAAEIVLTHLESTPYQRQATTLSTENVVLLTFGLNWPLINFRILIVNDYLIWLERKNLVSKATFSTGPYCLILSSYILYCASIFLFLFYYLIFYLTFIISIQWFQIFCKGLLGYLTVIRYQKTIF